MIRYIEPRDKSNIKFYLRTPDDKFLGELVLDNPVLQLKENDFSTLTFELPEKINGKENPRIKEVLHNYIIEVVYGDLNTDNPERQEKIQKIKFIIVKTPSDFNDGMATYQYEALSKEVELDFDKMHSWQGIKKKEYIEYVNNDATFAAEEPIEGVKNIITFAAKYDISDIDTITITQLQDNNNFSDPDAKENALKTMLVRYIPYNEEYLTNEELQEVLNKELVEGLYYYNESEKLFYIIVPSKVKREDLYVNSYYKYAITYRNDDIVNDGSLIENDYYTLDGLTIEEVIGGILEPTNWKLNPLDENHPLKNITRSSFDFNNISRYEAIKTTLESYGAVAVFNHINNTITLYKQDEYGEDAGLTLEYGKYILSLNKSNDSSKIVTRIMATGKDGITLTGFTPDGTDTYKDYSYFIDGLTWDGTYLIDKYGIPENDENFTPSRWMSNDLVRELLKLKAKYKMYKEELYGIKDEEDNYIKDGLYNYLDKLYTQIFELQVLLIEAKIQLEKFSTLQSAFNSLDDGAEDGSESNTKNYYIKNIKRMFNGNEVTYDKYLQENVFYYQQLMNQYQARIEELQVGASNHDPSEPIEDLDKIGSNVITDSKINALANTTSTAPTTLIQGDYSRTYLYAQSTYVELKYRVESDRITTSNPKLMLYVTNGKETLAFYPTSTEESNTSDITRLMKDGPISFYYKNETDNNETINIYIQDNSLPINRRYYGIKQIEERIKYINEELSESNLPQNLQEELKSYRKEYILTDTTIEKPLELFEKAKEYIEENNKPIVTITVDIIDILSAGEAYADWDKIVLGSLINIYFPKFDIDTKAQIKEITFEPQTNNLSVTISTVSNYERIPTKKLGRIIRDLQTTTENVTKNSAIKINQLTENVEELNEATSAANQLKLGADDIFGQPSIQASLDGLNLYETTIDPITDNIVVRGKARVSIGAGAIQIYDANGNVKTAINSNGIIAAALRGDLILGEQLIIKAEDDSVYIGKWYTSTTNDDYGIKLEGEMKDDEGNVTGSFVRTTISRDKGIKIEKSSDGVIYTPTLQINNDGEAEFAGYIMQNARFYASDTKYYTPQDLERVRLEILGGTRSFMYDADIKNPIPNVSEFQVKVYIDEELALNRQNGNDVILLPDRDINVSWNATGVLSGTSSESVFTPVIDTNPGAIKDTSVNVIVNIDSKIYTETIAIPIVTQGTGGSASYIWVKYSDEEAVNGTIPAGSAIYDNPTSSTKSIGLKFNQQTPTESNNIEDYQWLVFKGEQGEKGIDGYTLITSNDSIVLAADSDGNILENQADTEIIAYLYSGTSSVQVAATEALPVSNYGITITKDTQSKTVKITLDHTTIPVNVNGGSFTIEFFDDENSRKIAEKTFTFVKIKSGQDGVNSFLTNETGTVVANQDGDIITEQPIVTEMLVYKGAEQVTINNINVVSTVNCSTNINDNIITIIPNYSNDNTVSYRNGTAIIEAETNLGTFTKVFTFSVVNAGKDTYTMTINNETAAIPADENGVVPSDYNEIIDVQVYRGTSLLQYSTVPTVNQYNLSFNIYPENSATISNINNQITISNFTQNGHVEIIATVKTLEGDINLTKIFNYSIVKDGKQGAKGQDSYDVYLDSDNRVIYTSLDSGYPDTTIDVTITVGSGHDITSIPNPVTNGISYIGATGTGNSRTLTFNNISQDNGYADITIVVDGKSFTKRFNFAVVRQGEDVYNLMLSNENDTKSVYVAGEYIDENNKFNTTIRLFKGSTPLNISSSMFDINISSNRYTLSEINTTTLLLVIDELTTNLTENITITVPEYDISKVYTINQTIDWNGLTELVDGLPQIKGSRVVAGSITAHQINTAGIGLSSTIEDVTGTVGDIGATLDSNGSIINAAEDFGVILNDNRNNFNYQYGLTVNKGFYIKTPTNNLFKLTNEGIQIGHDWEANTILLDQNGIRFRSGQFSINSYDNKVTIGSMIFDGSNNTISVYSNNDFSNKTFYIDSNGNVEFAGKLKQNTQYIGIDNQNYDLNTLIDYRLDIVGGTRTINFSEDGISYRPSSIEPFAAEVYLGENLWTGGIEYQWSATGVYNHTNVTTNQQTFIPKVNSYTTNPTSVIVTVNLLDNNNQILKQLTKTIDIVVVKDAITPRTVRLTADKYVVLYDTEGNKDIDSIVLTAIVPNIDSNLQYKFYKNSAANPININYANNIYTITSNNLPAINTTDSWTVKVFENNNLVAYDTITIYGLQEAKDGTSPINILLSNETHTFTTDVNGNVIDYSNSGTIIEVYHGINQLVYSSTLDSNNTWRIASATGTNIDVGNRTINNNVSAVYSNHSNFINSANSAKIVYTIQAKINNEIITLVKEQTFGKAKEGEKGEQGEKGDQGIQGATGQGIVFRGQYDSNKKYYYTDERKDVVQYNNNYYIVNNRSKSGNSTWDIPNTSSDWVSFGAEFESVATDILLTNDVYADKTINIGNSGGSPVITLNADSNNNNANPFIGIGTTTYNNENGIYIGYNNGSPVLSLGNNITFQTNNVIFEDNTTYNNQSEHIYNFNLSESKVYTIQFEIYGFYDLDAEPIYIYLDDILVHGPIANTSLKWETISLNLYMTAGDHTINLKEEGINSSHTLRNFKIIEEGIFLGNDKIINLNQYGIGTKNLIIDSFGNATFSGKLQAATGIFSGELQAATGTFSGELQAATGTFSGELQAATGTFNGTIYADSGRVGSWYIEDGQLVSYNPSNYEEMAVIYRDLIFLQNGDGGKRIHLSTFLTTVLLQMESGDYKAILSPTDGLYISKKSDGFYLGQLVYITYFSVIEGTSYTFTTPFRPETLVFLVRNSNSQIATMIIPRDYMSTSYDYTIMTEPDIALDFEFTSFTDTSYTFKYIDDWASGSNIRHVRIYATYKGV